MKRIFILLIMILTMMLTGCGEVDDVNSFISNHQEGSVPTQAEYDAILGKFDEMSDNDKEKIENSDYLNSLRGLDLDEIISVQNDISTLTKEDNFDKVIVVLKRYDSLKVNEQNLVDSSNLDSIMLLSDEENAVLGAAENVKSVMKNENSFVLNSAKVKNDLDDMGFYWVLIEYSGQNGFGAMKDSTSCFGINKEFKDPFFALSLLTGVQKYLDATTSLMEYYDCDQPIIEINVDKINYYLSN